MSSNNCNFKIGDPEYESSIIERRRNASLAISIENQISETQNDNMILTHTDKNYFDVDEYISSHPKFNLKNYIAFNDSQLNYLTSIS